MIDLGYSLIYNLYHKGTALREWASIFYMYTFLECHDAIIGQGARSSISILNICVITFYGQHIKSTTKHRAGTRQIGEIDRHLSLYQAKYFLRCIVFTNKSLFVAMPRMFWYITTVYPKKYAHGFVVLCFVVVMQSFIMNSHEVFIPIHQGCFAGTGAIVRLPQCQWSKPDGYGKISQCITTTKHSKAKTVCIFLGIYCSHVRKRWTNSNYEKGGAKLNAFHLTFAKI